MLSIHNLTGSVVCLVDPTDSLFSDDAGVLEGVTVILAARLRVGQHKIRLLRGDQELSSAWTWADCRSAVSGGDVHLQLALLPCRSDGAPELLAAIESGHLPAVRRLLESLVDPNLAMNYRSLQSSPLVVAAYTNCGTEIAQALLEGRADVSGRGFAIRPLVAACERGNARAAQLFLRHGANVNERTYFGATPLHAAASAGNVRLARLLLRHGADVRARDLQERSCLQRAFQRGKLGVVRQLAWARAPLDQYSTVAASLHRAATKGGLYWMKLLLRLGACRRSTDLRGQPAVAVARRLLSFRQRFQLARLLRSL